MRNSIKGALLSGLLFPGSGQIAMKRVKRGIAIIITVLSAMAVIVMEAVQQARTVLERIQAEGGPMDIEAITNAANRAAAEDGGMLSSVAILLIVICWCFGVIDAYYLGKKIDSEKI